jgi:DNA-binding MarR family transcriptional regulator
MSHDPEQTRAAPADLSDGDYATLAAFRHSLRRFLAFSEEAARQAGLTPQHHQALLAIRGLAPEQGVTVGDLAGHLLLKPNTAVGLVDRLVQAGLLLRTPDAEDRRRVLLSLTTKANAVLRDLSATHLTEIRGNAPQLADLLRRLSGQG